MKINKVSNHRLQHKKSCSEAYINKKISQQNQKLNFFMHLLQQIQNNFSEQNLQVLLKDMQASFYQKLKINFSANQSFSKPFHHHTLSSTIEYKTKNQELMILQKIEASILGNNTRIMNVKPILFEKMHKYNQVLTPKHKLFQTNMIPKKLIQIDKLMHRNNQKTRNRLLIHKQQDYYKAKNTYTSSYSLQKIRVNNIKRCNTQSQEIDNQAKWQHIPRCLLPNKLGQKASFKQNQITYNQRRMQSLLKKSYNSIQKIRKNKANQ